MSTRAKRHIAMTAAVVIVAGCMSGGDDSHSSMDPASGAGAGGTSAGAGGTSAGTDGTSAGAGGTSAGAGGTNAGAGGTNAGAGGTDAGAGGTNAGAGGTNAGTGTSAGTVGTNAGAGGTNAGTDAGAVIPAEESYDASGRIVEACHGMELVGMKHSPGGTILPNKCAPFDVRHNNPFAVRCIDAMPDFATPFAGDEFCILPPPPELGFQLGVHPGGNIGYWEKMWADDYSFYEDPAATAEFMLPAGVDTSLNYDVEVEEPSGEHYYYRRHFRARYGSHHGRAAWPGSPVTEGWKPDNLLAAIVGTELINMQNAYTDIPERAMEISPEERGIGTRVPENSGVIFNLHYFNITEAPVLRENWINVWYVPTSEVTRVTGYIYGQAAAINYPPGMILDNESVIPAPLLPTQILSMFGHRHAWTTRFHAWVVRADGTQELVYDSYDWGDMPTFAYNSVTENPEPGGGNDGATSGLLVLQPGDALHYNCHVETTPERASELGVPRPTTTVPWANDAIGGEMCSLTAITVPFGG